MFTRAAFLRRKSELRKEAKTRTPGNRFGTGSPLRRTRGNSPTPATPAKETPSERANDSQPVGTPAPGPNHILEKGNRRSRRSRGTPANRYAPALPSYFAAWGD